MRDSRLSINDIRRAVALKLGDEDNLPFTQMNVQSGLPKACIQSLAESGCTRHSLSHERFVRKSKLASTNASRDPAPSSDSCKADATGNRIIDWKVKEVEREIQVQKGRLETIERDISRYEQSLVVIRCSVRDLKEPLDSPDELGQSEPVACGDRHLELLNETSAACLRVVSDSTFLHGNKLPAGTSDPTVDSASIAISNPAEIIGMKPELSHQYSRRFRRSSYVST